MAKSPALLARIKGFAAKLADGFDSAIGNSVTVDNSKIPTSAYSMAQRKNAMTGKTPTYQFATKQNTFGSPNTK
jgi:hypothetical protein